MMSLQNGTRLWVVFPLFVFLATLLVSSGARRAEATPGTCDRLCRSVNYYKDCATGDFIETKLQDCLGCQGKNTNECVDGRTADCTQISATGQKVKRWTGGTKSICNCNEGIKTIEATAVSGDSTSWSVDLLQTGCTPKPVVID